MSFVLGSKVFSRILTVIYLKIRNDNKFIFLKFLPPQIKNIFYIYLIKKISINI